MRLKAEDKEKIKNRIITGAAKELRAHGYEQVNLDAVMKGAALTRGAFYAHFSSKAELFEAVVRREHPLLKMLQARDGTDATTLHTQLMQLFKAYLDPDNLEEVFVGCSVASLTGDVTRASSDIKQAYQAAWNEIADELGRGQTVTNPAALNSALTLATGAVATAQASADHAQRAKILHAAFHCFEQLIMVGISKPDKA